MRSFAMNRRFRLNELADLMVFDNEEGVSKPDERIYCEAKVIFLRQAQVLKRVFYLRFDFIKSQVENPFQNLSLPQKNNFTKTLTVLEFILSSAW
jgi:hypothetical protein